MVIIYRYGYILSRYSLSDAVAFPLTSGFHAETLMTIFKVKIPRKIIPLRVNRTSSNIESSRKFVPKRGINKDDLISSLIR